MSRGLGKIETLIIKTLGNGKKHYSSYFKKEFIHYNMSPSQIMKFSGLNNKSFSVRASISRALKSLKDKRLLEGGDFYKQYSLTEKGWEYYNKRIKEG